jgi:serine/threonine protein kinase
MELVSGEPITDYCDRRRLPVRARLELFVTVCQAVQHAHQKGIIHRDLKPSNVMVAEVDGRASAKVIDFGVAKATEFKLTDQSLADTGAIVGTPTYMSPEQADPSSMDIDTRTDIYALGVILYELLAGSPPIDAKQFKRGAILEMLRMVREVDPPKPSTKVSTADALPSIAASRDVEPAHLKRALQGDLDWIVMMALEKDRTRRYATANAARRGPPAAPGARAGGGRPAEPRLQDAEVCAEAPRRGDRGEPRTDIALGRTGGRGGGADGGQHPACRIIGPRDEREQGTGGRQRQARRVARSGARAVDALGVAGLRRQAHAGPE